MRGCSSIRLKHRIRAPSTENATSGQVLVRTRGGEKGRPVAAPDETLLQTMRGCSSIASNTGAAHLQRKTQKSGQVLVRTRSREKGRPSGGSGRDALLQPLRSCSSIAPNAGSAHLQRKTQKADRFWFAPGAATKAGQWRLRTRRFAGNRAGLFLDRPKHRIRAPSTKNAKKRTGFGSHAGR
jgi:uncharacterized protein YceK